MTATHDGREHTQMGISWNCQRSFFTLFGPPPMPPALLKFDTIGSMMGGAVDSNCVIDWVLIKLETKRRGEEIGIQMGICCQRGFSALWFDGERRENLTRPPDLRVSMSFGLRSIRFGGILAPPNRLAVIDGSHNTLVSGNKSSLKQSLWKTNKDTK